MSIYMRITNTTFNLIEEEKNQGTIQLSSNKLNFLDAVLTLNHTQANFFKSFFSCGYIIPNVNNKSNHNPLI